MTTPGRHLANLRALWCWLPHSQDCDSLKKPGKAFVRDCDCARFQWLGNLDGLHYELTDMHIIDCLPQDRREEHRERAMSRRIEDMGMKGRG